MSGWLIALAAYMGLDLIVTFLMIGKRIRVTLGVALLALVTHVTWIIVAAEAIGHLR